MVCLFVCVCVCWVGLGGGEGGGGVKYVLGVNRERQGEFTVERRGERKEDYGYREEIWREESGRFLDWQMVLV